MKKAQFILVVLLIVSMLLLAACGGGSAPAQGAGQGNPITIRLAHVVAEDSHFGYAAERFRELVEERTNGEITVEIFPAGQLGQEREVLENLQSDAIEMTITGHDPLAMFVPMIAALSMPYVFDDEYHAFRVVDSDFGVQIQEEALAQNLRILAFGANGFRVTTTSDAPIHTPEDMQGVRIRTPQAPVNLAIMEALGAVPIALPFGETYSALQQGVVEGQENALPQIYDSRFAEVQSYLSLTNHLYGFTTLIIGEPAFERLTSEQQEIVIQAGYEAMMAQRTFSMNLSNNVLVDALEAEGLTVIRPDLALFREATRDVHLQFIDEFGGLEIYEWLLSIR